MTRWRVDAPGERARRCATFDTAILAAVKLAKPGVELVTIEQVDRWTDLNIHINWDHGLVSMRGQFSWDQMTAATTAFTAHLLEHRGGS